MPSLNSRLLCAVALLIGFGLVIGTASAAETDPEGALYKPSDDPLGDVQRAVAVAGLTERRALVVLGLVFGLMRGLGSAFAALLWLVGFFFEVIGDEQLHDFQQDPENRGRILDRNHRPLAETTDEGAGRVRRFYPLGEATFHQFHGGVATNVAIENWLLKAEAAGIDGLGFLARPGRELSRLDLLLGGGIDEWPRERLDPILDEFEVALREQATPASPSMMLRELLQAGDGRLFKPTAHHTAQAFAQGIRRQRAAVEKSRCLSVHVRYRCAMC